MPLRARFETFFEKRGVDECWMWLGALNNDGYGGFRIGSLMDKAHRVSFRIYKGEIPVGMQVLHSCDRPGCVNPNHLSVGTILRNQHEAWARGLKKNAHRVSPHDVIAIRESNLPQKELAKFYGVSQPQISKIKRKIRGDGILLQLNGVFQCQ
jgi:hypothetical protein